MTLLCACGCGRPVTGRRKGAKYASNRCRAKAGRARRSGVPATFRSARRLKSGTVQLILHVPALWGPQAYVRQRGEPVWVILPEPQP